MKLFRVLCLLFGFSIGLNAQRNELEYQYFQWIASGGYEVLEQRKLEAERANQVALQYEVAKKLNKMGMLTLEIHNLNLELNQQIVVKAELFNQGLVNLSVDTKIKKLSKELKDKAGELDKLAK